VYSATVLYWLEDKSEGCADTWKFLDRRLVDVLRIPQAFGRLRDRLTSFPKAFRPFVARR
jgi:ubiquinone biosynthesis protein COQ9